MWKGGRRTLDTLPAPTNEVIVRQIRERTPSTLWSNCVVEPRVVGQVAVAPPPDRSAGRPVKRPAARSGDWANSPGRTRS